MFSKQRHLLNAEAPCVLCGAAHRDESVSVMGLLSAVYPNQPVQLYSDTLHAAEKDRLTPGVGSGGHREERSWVSMVKAHLNGSDACSMWGQNAQDHRRDSHLDS